MRFHTLFLLLIVLCASLTLAQMTYDDCCFKYVKGIDSKSHKHVVAYRRQVADGGCNLEALIFIMRKGRQLCADPKAAWVINLKERIDKRKAKRARSRRPLRG